MAKAKKSKLAIEDALVPVEEQPYEIPENWCWTRPLVVFDIEYGKGLSTKELTEDGYPVFGANGQIGYYSEYMFEEEMALMSCRGAYSGTMNCSLPYSYVTSNSLVMKDKGCFVSPRFIYYMYSALNTDKLVSGSAQPQVTVQAFNDYAIPLPPLAEQKRIVEQIEKLFSKLDEAKEKAESAIESFSKRRDAVLYNAFQGKLTENWRKEKLCRLDDWNNVIIKDVCIDIKVGIVIKPTQYYVEKESGIPAFRSANVRDSYIEDNDWVFINEKGQRENQRSEVHTGDVLIVRSGNPGTACVVTEEYDGYNAIDIIIAVPDQEKVLPQYLCYYTNSPECKGMVDSNKRGMALQHFNVGGYSKLPISVPSLDEQHIIVQTIERELEEESKAKVKIQLVIEQIDIMKKSILAKAFRGGLGTNDSDEESAIELLKMALSKG